MAKRSGHGPLLTRRELAAVEKVHMSTVTKWERDGCPAAKRAPRGRATLFDQAEVRAWRDATDAARRASGRSLENERARLTAAHAVARERQNQVRAGELLPVAEIAAVWEDILGVVRSRLLSLPSSLAPTLAQETEPRVIFARLTEAVSDALSELARWRPPADPDGTLVSTPPSTPPSSRRRP